MASRKPIAAKADWRTIFRQSIARSLVIAAAALLAAFTLFLTLAFVTYDSTDAALNTAANGNAANWMGAPGAWFADLGLSIGGAPVVLLLPLLGVMAWRLWVGEPQPYWLRQLAYSFIGILLVGLGAELWAPASGAPMPAGWGGIIALVVGGAITPLFALAGEPGAALARFAAIVVLVLLGLWLAFRALRLEKGWASRLKLPAATSSRVVEPAKAAEAGAKAPNLMERVIRPRFADAKFFYDEDRKTSLAAHQEALKSVTYQQQLGSVWDKCVRVAELEARVDELETRLAQARRTP